MGQYCDSKQLETNWYKWLLASATPSLENYRELGLLWTKVIGKVTDGDGQVLLDTHDQPYPDPQHPVRTHCVALAVPIYFNSYHGEPQKQGRIYRKNRWISEPLPDDQILNLQSDSWLHNLDDPLSALCDVLPRLKSKGYIQESPTKAMWNAMLEDINKICHGIATRFNPPTKDDHAELTHEALLQVIKKLVSKRLVYTPGRAPVFNLLTTTIFRCMYSIQNSRKRQRLGMFQLATDMQAGILPDNIHSFKVGMTQGTASIRTQ